MAFSMKFKSVFNLYSCTYLPKEIRNAQTYLHFENFGRMC